MSPRPSRTRNWLVLLLVVCTPLAGCRTTPFRKQQSIVKHLPPPPVHVPRELQKVSLPPYTIEPPDILLIDAVRIVPKEPYRIAPLDVLFIQATGTFPDQPIDGAYAVSGAGSVDLGPAYGTVTITGKTLSDARKVISEHLSRVLREPQVSITLVEHGARQQIAGEHLVSPDGTVSLGTYGSVYVTGMQLWQAKRAIESHLARYLEAPEISVDVFAYNSKVYYVITEGGGYGDAVNRFPITGNETVLDAISQVNGLQAVSSKRIWVARPAPHTNTFQVLAVDWRAITQGGSAFTNYQILPGDRVFIAEDRMVAFDSVVGKLVSPFERMFGFTLLGTTTIQAVNRFPDGGAGGAGFF